MQPTATALSTSIAVAAPGFTPAAPAVPPPAFVPYADAGARRSELDNAEVVTAGEVGVESFGWARFSEHLYRADRQL